MIFQVERLGRHISLDGRPIQGRSDVLTEQILHPIDRGLESGVTLEGGGDRIQFDSHLQAGGSRGRPFRQPVSIVFLL